MNRCGIAIMISLMFVLLALVFSTVFFSYLNSSLKFNTNEYALVQKNLIYLDSIKMLKNAKQLLGQRFTPKEFIDKFNALHISTKPLGVEINITSLHSKINFNNYRDGNKTNENFDKLLKNLLQFYNVKDQELCRKILSNSAIKDTNSSYDLVKIADYGVDHQSGDFIGIEHFYKAVDLYSKASNDKNIYNIPWGEIFIFAPQDTGRFLDCDQISPTLKKELNRQYGVDENQCSKSEIDFLNIKKVTAENIYFVIVDINFDINGAKEKLRYYFDLKSDKVLLVE